MPAPVRNPLFEISRHTITTVATPARLEPTARSIPPVMMTKVMPSAIMPTEELERSTFSAFTSQLLPQSE